MANSTNVRSESGLHQRVLTQLWKYAVDSFVKGDDVEVMDGSDVDNMMARVLGTQENTNN